MSLTENPFQKSSILFYIFESKHGLASSFCQIKYYIMDDVIKLNLCSVSVLEFRSTSSWSITI